jgi:hypothetical protein
MYPACWKVERTKWPGLDNDTCNFFRTKEEALQECARRNKEKTNEM